MIIDEARGLGICLPALSVTLHTQGRRLPLICTEIFERAGSCDASLLVTRSRRILVSAKLHQRIEVASHWNTR